MWSGRLFLGVVETVKAAEELECEVVDWFSHVGEPGIQPKGRTRKDGKPVLQHHARTNASTLLVVRKPKRGRRPAPTLFDEPEALGAGEDG